VLEQPRTRDHARRGDRAGRPQREARLHEQREVDPRREERRRGRPRDPARRAVDRVPEAAAARRRRREPADLLPVRRRRGQRALSRALAPALRAAAVPEAPPVGGGGGTPADLLPVRRRRGQRALPRALAGALRPALEVGAGGAVRVHLRPALAAAALAAAAAGCREASRGAPAATAPVASAAVGAAPAESAPEADLRIAYDAARDRLDLVARDVPLPRVPAAPAAETGVAIEDESGRDRTGRVSPQLEGVPLADATSELLRGEAKAFGFSPPGPGAPARLVRILLLPPRGDRVAAVVAAVHD